MINRIMYPIQNNTPFTSDLLILNPIHTPVPAWTSALPIIHRLLTWPHLPFLLHLITWGLRVPEYTRSDQCLIPYRLDLFGLDMPPSKGAFLCIPISNNLLPSSINIGPFSFFHYISRFFEGILLSPTSIHKTTSCRVCPQTFGRWRGKRGASTYN